MKGPSERLKYDLRRVWECPVCKHREKTPGSATSCLCHCQTQRPPDQWQYMKLVDDRIRRLIASPASRAAVLDSPPPVEISL